MAYLPAFKLPKAITIKTADQARQVAIDWQEWQSHQALSYGETIFYHNYFTLLATKFNLTDEFQENGVL